MSKKAKRKEVVSAEGPPPLPAPRKALRLKIIAPVLVIVLMSFAAWMLWPSAQTPKPSAQPAAEASAPPAPTNVFKQPTTFTELCQVPDEQLGKVDLALMNLLSTEGLPGAEDMNVPHLLSLLDGLAQGVKFETERHLYKFRRNPGEFQNSEGYYRMAMMATVLQQDLGVRYNPDRIAIPGASDPEPDEIFNKDSRDIFIHGLCRTNGMGTCASMPVFYAAIGRRLGYPLKLANAKGHVFLRWDEGGKTFNVDATTLGFVSNSDDHYRQWPYPITPDEERTQGWLKSFTPTQELSLCLHLRGQCLRAAKKLLPALGAFAEALRRDPGSMNDFAFFARAEREAFEAGVLPTRAAINYVLKNLDIPNGPAGVPLQMKRAMIETRLHAGAGENELAAEVSLLNAEVVSLERQLAADPGLHPMHGPRPPGRPGPPGQFGRSGPPAGPNPTLRSSPLGRSGRTAAETAEDR